MAGLLNKYFRLHFLQSEHQQAVMKRTIIYYYDIPKFLFDEHKSR